MKETLYKINDLVIFKKKEMLTNKFKKFSGKIKKQLAIGKDVYYEIGFGSKGEIVKVKQENIEISYEQQQIVDFKKNNPTLTDQRGINAFIDLVKKRINKT